MTTISESTWELAFDAAWNLVNYCVDSETFVVDDCYQEVRKALVGRGDAWVEFKSLTEDEAIELIKDLMRAVDSNGYWVDMTERGGEVILHRVVPYHKEVENEE